MGVGGCGSLEDSRAPSVAITQMEVGGDSDVMNDSWANPKYNSFSNQLLDFYFTSTEKIYTGGRKPIFSGVYRNR
jgi:hypothetical protein